MKKLLKVFIFYIFFIYLNSNKSNIEKTKSNFEAINYDNFEAINYDNDLNKIENITKYIENKKKLEKMAYWNENNILKENNPYNNILGMQEIGTFNPKSPFQQNSDKLVGIPTADKINKNNSQSKNS
jgi:hypothetical protein